jgi:hypothetical protein
VGKKSDEGVDVCGCVGVWVCGCVVRGCKVAGRVKGMQTDADRYKQLL